MEYIAFVFSIFGLLAYTEISSLKSRITQLERSLTKMEGTTQHIDRKALVKAASEYIGSDVVLDLKEDYQDADIMLYGNTKNGSNIILDADEDWILVETRSKKGTETKLIRTEGLESIAKKNA